MPNDVRNELISPFAHRADENERHFRLKHLFCSLGNIIEKATPGEVIFLELVNAQKYKVPERFLLKEQKESLLSRLCAGERVWFVSQKITDYHYLVAVDPTRLESSVRSPNALARAIQSEIKKNCPGNKWTIFNW